MMTGNSLRNTVAGLFVRHGLPVSPIYAAKAGLGVFATMILLGLLSESVGLTVLIAPFGASAVLLFGHPASPLAQPVNIAGSYLLGVVLTCGHMAWFPGSSLAAALSLAILMILMLMLRITHPPAGAIPLIAVSGEAQPIEMALAVILGASVLTALALLRRTVPPRSNPDPGQPELVQPASAVFDDGVSPND